MDDPFTVHTAGDIAVTCQLIHVARRGQATVIDLITLEPSDREGEQLPAGTPVTLGFDTDEHDEQRRQLNELLERWQVEDSPLTLEASAATSGIRYRFSDGVELLTLYLDEAPSSGHRPSDGGRTG